MGLAVGWLLRRLFFSARAQRTGLLAHAEAFGALASIFLAYGAAELIAGYGFIAVFVCACTIRAVERDDGRHRVAHTYVEQLERLLTVVLLILLGGAVSRGILTGLGWGELGLAAVFLLLIRPAAGWLGLAGGRTGARERAVISFFGVRGIGSLYYLAYALSEADFPGAEQLWRVTALVVLASVVLHGVTATPVMRWLDRRRAATARSAHGTEEKAPITAV